MTPNAKAIWLTESLVDAARLMWENNCGVLPIIKDGMKVIGLITDRDVCMASAMRDRNPSAISVEEVMTGQVYAVGPEDNINQALQLMQGHQIRRLPVINPEGLLEGSLSLNDIVLRAEPNAAAADSIDYGEALHKKSLFWDFSVQPQCPLCLCGVVLLGIHQPQRHRGH